MEDVVRTGPTPQELFAKLIETPEFQAYTLVEIAAKETRDRSPEYAALKSLPLFQEYMAALPTYHLLKANG